MRRLLFLSTVGLLMAISLPSAAGAVDWKALDKAAKKACLTGDFRKGADILTQLYVDTDDPTYLFNQGRCYEQNHRWQEALDSFREYKRKVKKLTRAEAADTERHIADCELFIAKEEAKKLAQPTPVSPPPLGTATAATPARADASSNHPSASEPAAGVATVAVPTAASESAGVGLRTVGIVLAGVGVVSVVAGVLLNVQANSLADGVNQHYSRSKASTHSSYETLSWVGYGLGAAAIVSAGICYVLGVRQRGSSSAPDVAVLPAAGRGQGGLILEETF
jgi:hypothetical protein